MPKRVKLKGFAGRCLRLNTVCVIPFAIFFCAVWQGFEHEKTWLIVVGFVGSFCSVAIGFAANILLLMNVKCPICGYVMREPLPSDWQGRRRRAILFYCPKCEIKWDTGMMEGDN